MKKLIFPVMYFCFAMTCQAVTSTEVSVITEERSDGSVAMELIMSEIDTHAITTLPGEAVKVELEGYPRGGKPGEPMLPYSQVRLLVPTDTDLKTITAELTEGSWQELPGEYEIAPTPPMVTGEKDEYILKWRGKDASVIIDGRDTTIYNEDKYFPERAVEILSIGEFHQWKLVEVRTWLAAYNPVIKKVLLLNDAVAEISMSRLHEDTIANLEESVIAPGQISDKHRETLLGMINNPEDLALFYPVADSNHREESGRDTIYDFVIITTEEIRDSNENTKLSVYIDLKIACARKVNVVTESTVMDPNHYVSGATADERANNIRDWLQTYITGIEDVLLIGDPRPDQFSGISVPMKICKPADDNDKYKIPTDMFYAELSNTWDKDTDGRYGEWGDDYDEGGCDKYCEVNVGRIPFYGHYSHLNPILQKTVDYCYPKSSSLDWRDKVLIAAAISNFAPQDNNGDGDAKDPGEHRYTTERTFGADWGQAVDSNATSAGMSPYTLYEKDGIYSDGSAYSTLTCDASLTSVNFLTEWKKAYGFVTWWAHGDPTIAWRFCWKSDDSYKNTCNKSYETKWWNMLNSSSCYQLDDEHPSFVVLAACNNAKPEEKMNLAYSLLKNGAIGSVGATRSSLYSAGSWTKSTGATFGDGPAYGYYIFERMANYDYTIGEALTYCKRNFGSTGWENMLVFNLYGDPSISLDTAYTNLVPMPPSKVFAYIMAGYAGIIHLRWQDNSANEAGFDVQYKKIGQSTWYDLRTTGPDQTTAGFTCSSPNDVSYTFRVRSFNAYGNSSWIAGGFPTPTGSGLGPTVPGGGEIIKSGSTQPIIWGGANSIPESVSISYSTDGGSSWLSPPIASDIPNTGLFSWTIPNTEPNSEPNNCLIMIEDANQANDPNFNMTMTPFEITPMPDLIVESITIDPPEPNLNDSITVDVTVKNQGGADASSFSIDWYNHLETPPEPNQTGTFNIEVSSLAAGESVTMTEGYQYTVPGWLNMYARVDCSNDVNESFENNNVFGPQKLNVYEFETLSEEYNTMERFGGSDINEFKPRNVGIGQSVTLSQNSHVHSMEFCFADVFDYNEVPDCYGHDVTLVLNIRSDNGSILETVEKTVSKDFHNGWISFDLDKYLWADESYIFTCYLKDGETLELNSGVIAHTEDSYPNGVGYSALIESFDDDIEDWNNWDVCSVDFLFRLTGHYIDFLPGDIDVNGVVDSNDLEFISQDWLLNDEFVDVNAPDSPILYYDFNETSGCIVHDCSGNGYDGVAKLENGSAASALWQENGKYYGCIRFQSDDKDYCVEVPNDVLNDNITDQITVSVWVNWDQASFGLMSCDPNSFMFSAQGGIAEPYESILGIKSCWTDCDLEFLDSAQNAYYKAGPGKFSDAWNHYACVKSVQEQKLMIYLNGRLVAETNSSEIMDTPVDLVRIGLAADDWRGEYTGLLDDFKIFDYALSEEEIRYLATDGTGYLPLISPANIFDKEPKGSKIINFKDYAAFATYWLDGFE